MIHPDTQQVFVLSDYFHDLANALGEFIERNRSQFTPEERNSLFDSQVNLLQLSGDINMLGVAIVFDDVQQSLDQLEDITKSVKKSVKKALAVQYAINIATSLVELANAIISRDPKVIGTKTVDAFKAIKQ